MSEHTIKPGDRIAAGPYIVGDRAGFGDPYFEIVACETCGPQFGITIDSIDETAFPWHPSLPAVARLLAEPGVVESLKATYAHLITYGFLPDDDLSSLIRFVAALEGSDGN